jgi:hypothetical protein
MSLIATIQQLNPFATTIWDFSFEEELPEGLLSSQCLGIFEYLNQNKDFLQLCDPNKPELTTKLPIHFLYQDYLEYLAGKPQYEKVSKKAFFKEVDKVLKFSKITPVKKRTAAKQSNVYRIREYS